MNVPKYNFWSLRNATQQYKFQFSRMYEATPSKNGQLQMVGASNIAFASLDWLFSTPQANVNENCEGESTFNITNIGDPKKGRWSNLTVVNHLKNQKAYGVKFDIVIDNYIWTQSDESSVLVVEIDLTGNPGFSIEEVNGSVRLGDAFFNATNTAQIYPGKNLSVPVDMSTSGNTIQLVYGHFPAGASLVHDPLVGLESLITTTPDNGPNDKHIGLIVGLTLGLVAFVAIVAILALGVFIRLRNRHQYEKV
jgi:hypothetical protein